MAEAPPEDRGERHRPPRPVRWAARAGALVALALFAVLLCEGSPSGLLRRGPFSSDFFDAQAEALLHGHLDVDPQVASIEGFDHAGRTQLYFGLVPAVLRLPVAAVTDRFEGRLTQVSMLAALAVAMWAASRLLWRARRWRRGDGPPTVRELWIVGGFTAAVGLASPLLFLAARPVVYHETELWGTATALVSLELLLAWWQSPTLRSLAVASLGALVAFNTRASVGGGAVAALALTAALGVVVRRVPWRIVPALGLAVLLPVAVYAAVNQARFGEPFGVPFREQVLSRTDAARQATLDATDGTLFGLEFAPTALVTYGRPDGIVLQTLFPWITFREPGRVIGDATFDTVDRSASLPVVAPSLVLLALLGAGALMVHGRRSPWLTAVLGVSAGLISTVTIAFIANRYLSDFTPTLVLLAAVGTWTAVDWLGRRRRGLRWAAAAALVALTTVGMVVSAALAIQSQRLFILPRDQARHDLVAFQYDLFDQLDGSTAPDVRRATTLDRPGRRGEVALMGACDGLYWSDGRRWWPLELSGPAGWVVTGPVGGGRTVLLHGAGWEVVAESDDEATDRAVVVSYLGSDGTIRRGEPVDRDRLDGRPIHIALDRVNSELKVTAGDREVLRAWLVDLGGDPRPADGFRSHPADTPLCRDLEARLDGPG